jgi:amidase
MIQGILSACRINATSQPHILKELRAGKLRSARISTFSRSLIPFRPVIRDAVTALENAGAIVEEVKLGIHRSSEELGNLHHRSMMSLYLPVFERFKKNGIDLLRDHRQDFPLELLKWVDGFKQSTLDFYRDQEVRTEIYDNVQVVLNTYDLLVTPTLACLPVDNAEDGNTIGPSEINGISIDQSIRCSDGY